MKNSIPPASTPKATVRIAGAARDIPALRRETLPAGFSLQGPALILETGATTFVDDGWRAEITPQGDLLLTRTTAEAPRAIGADADPILLEIFNNRFMAVAEEMGLALQTTAASVNIRERLDFSCAVFDAKGGLVANAPHILAVRDGLPVKTAAELIALAKRNPGKYTFASAGTGTIVQMGGELFKHEAGIDILHVPYKGGAPATLALLSGDVDMTVNDLTTLKANFATGKLRPLGVAHGTRLKLLPDVPTFAEIGIPGIMSSTWWGIAVPVKTPADIQARLRAASARIVGEPEYVARLATMAIEPLSMTPEQSVAFIAGEVRKWRTVANAANIRMD